MVNLSQIPKRHIWRSTSFEEVSTLRTATSLTLNASWIVLLKHLQEHKILLMSKSERMLQNELQKGNRYLVFILHTVEIYCNLILKNDWAWVSKNVDCLTGPGTT